MEGSHPTTDAGVSSRVGLSRFVAGGRPAAGPPEARDRFRPPRPEPRPGEACELCGEALGHQHQHVVHLDHRSLLCVCRACYLLFTRDGAAGGRYRAVPQRYATDPSFRLSAAQWEDVQIPVGVAFFFRNSQADQWVAFYPSPAGATESMLDLQVWDEVLAANPSMAEAQPDVEALLVRRGDQGFECFLVPIDACYELVGRVRASWKGFDGGQEAWDALDGFFADLRERSEVLGGAAP